MEGIILLVLGDLLGTDDQAMRAVGATLGARQLKDLLTALGTIRLTEVGAKRLKSLCERFSKHNTKRNHIVHGSWSTVVIMKDAGGGLTTITTTWVRSYTAVQYDLAQQAGRYDLPNIGENIAFTIPQMNTALGRVQTLMGDFAALLSDLPLLRTPAPPSQPEPQ